MHTRSLRLAGTFLRPLIPPRAFTASPLLPPAPLSLPGGVRRVTQRVDLGAAQRVTNTIFFAGGFVGVTATGPLRVAGPKRMVYTFDGITLTLAGLTLPQIPFGPPPPPSQKKTGGGAPGAGGGRRGGVGGWTDTVYCDEELRVVRNFQEDLLIFRRTEEAEEEVEG